MFQLPPFFRTLRFRLAAWNALVVILTAGLTLLMVRQGVQFALLHEMDQILTEDLREISLALDTMLEDEMQTLQTDLERKATGHEHHGWFVRLLDARSQLLWASSAAPGQEMGGTFQKGEPITIGNYRSVQLRTNSGPRELAYVQVGAKLNFLHEDMARIDFSVFLSGMAILILAPLCGYWLAGRAAQPLANIIQAAAQMRADHLTERLSLRGTGDELDQLAGTINSLLDRIAQYVDRKRDFLANAAHELRTPLSAIRSSVEVALGSDRPNQVYQDLLGDLIEQTSSLENLVNQLLLLSETETDQWKSHRQMIALNTVVASSVEMFQVVAENRNIDLRLTQLDEIQVLGNRNHLWQVVNNLLDNAIKYTPFNGRITVSLSKKADQACLIVRDTGIGIAEKDRKKIFDRFYRADRARTRGDAGGVGLGLSICAAVVAAHEGSIDLDSSVGEGTTFTIKLPVQCPSVQTASNNLASEDNL